ncbi:MAG TPA: NAD(P)-dependent oxidoreductase [Bryobacteraceae bacterium]|nr:NAD(P)-dependent oxidoreductase [Bryobacteraceae bacterium]
MDTQLRVGFIGLGIMGAPMAANILKAGFRLSVYNRTASKCESLAKAGASVGASPADVARRSDIVFTILSDTPDVEEVLFGSGGVNSGIQPGAMVVDMSTISAAATVEFARRLEQHSVTMLDAPVSGGESGAIAGTLSIMAGGEKSAFDRCLPVLQAMGKNIVYTGPSGSGQKTKMVNQVVGALNLLAIIEGLRLAEAADLDLHSTIQAIGAGAAGSWMVSNQGPKIAAGDFSPGFFIKLQQKDLRLATELLEELKMDAPGTELTFKLFSQALQRGLGELGNQGLYRLWR